MSQALDYAHHRGILHRDVKPANVLLTADCTAKLADFNISFSSQLEGASPAAYFGGSLAYMSPEQLEACNPEHERQPDSLDGRADLYSLAAMLWELLYGVRPFREENLTGAWSATLAELTRRRRSEIPTPPEGMEQTPLIRSITEVLVRALSQEAGNRPANGAALARELALCLQPRSKALLELPRGGLRRFVRSWPLVSAVVAVLVPNMFGGAFNLAYNTDLVPNVWTTGWWRWMTIVTIGNIVYFSIGGLLVYYIIGPATNTVWQTLHSKTITPELAIEMRRRLLNFGHIAAFLGAIVWATAGIVFPAAVHAFFAQEVDPDRPIDVYLYLHFLASMVICGMIAAAYPFFALTLLSTKYYFPALLPFAPGTDEEDARLKALEDQTFPYLAVATGPPIAGALIILLMSLLGKKEEDRFVLLVLISVGGIGFLIAYSMYKRIHTAIEDLRTAMHPLDSATSLTETADALNSTI